MIWYGMVSHSLHIGSSLVVDEARVFAVQARWAAAVVDIGRCYADGGDYRGLARARLSELYGFAFAATVFKPTLATQVAFRTDLEMALSYFVGGAIAEDKGFALHCWDSVDFGCQHITCGVGLALAAGHYYFANGDAKVKAEFSFVYACDSEDRLRIILHHSSLPYGSIGVA